MNEIKDYKYLDDDFYNSVKEVLEQARKRVYRNIQSEMVFTYWQIGKMIVEKQGGEDRAKYGNCLIKELSIKLTNDLGKGFDERELRRMRQFYSVFPNRDTLCPELSWSHYRLLIRIDDYAIRDFYKNETIKCTWSVRQLEREINTFSYKRYLASHSDHNVIDDTAKRESSPNPKDIIKDPYVLDFIGLKPDSSLLYGYYLFLSK